jgi:hypothetical protein
MEGAALSVRVQRTWDSALSRTAESRPDFSAAVLLTWSMEKPAVDAGVPAPVAGIVSRVAASMGPVAFRLFFAEDLPAGIRRLPAPRAWPPVRLWQRLTRSWPAELAVADDASGAAEMFSQDWELQGQLALVLGDGGAGETTLDRLRRARDWRGAGFPADARLLIAPAVDGDGILLAAAGAAALDRALDLLLAAFETAGIPIHGGDDAPDGMEIETSHHVDASEPDAQGFHDYHYEYDIHRFSRAGRTYFARSYVDQPGRAAFLSCLEGGESRMLESDDLIHPLLVAAADHLRGAGMTMLERLGAAGYAPLEMASTLRAAQAGAPEIA